MLKDYFTNNDRAVQYYLDHFPSPDISAGSGLQYLRDKLFIAVLLVFFPVCCLVYIPSITVSILTRQAIIAFFNTAGMGALLFVFFSKNRSIRLKKMIFSSIFYVLSVVLFLYLGIKGPSVVILICMSLMITLFQSQRAGLISVALNSVIFLSLMTVSPVTTMKPDFFREFNIASWIAVGFNMVAFNTLMVISVASLVDQLYKSLLEEKKLLDLLKRESLDLMAAKQKAEESDRLKTAFLDNLSHEIRTPMNGILGFSSFLSDPDLARSDQQQYIGFIRKSSTRMLNIITEIVEISRIESGQVVLSDDRVNINELMAELSDLLKPDADDKKLHFSCETALADLDAVICTDSTKLLTILTNLVRNAIKYTDLGAVRIGYTVKPADSEAPGQEMAMLEFFVRDTGIGIPPDRQKAIFDRFVQADIADIQARQGAGLGLSIAKAYVEMMAGKIRVDSLPGKGSAFYVTIPFNAAHAYQPDAATILPNK